MSAVSDRIHLAVDRVHDRRRDPGRVVDDVGVRRPAVEGNGHRERRAGDVARRDREGKAQRERAVDEAQRLLVFDRDLDCLAGADRGHARGEEVRALLVNERGVAARLLRVSYTRRCPRITPTIRRVPARTSRWSTAASSGSGNR
jgi:hypothetical protein